MFVVSSNAVHKQKILQWADRHFDTYCLLNSNGYHDQYSLVNWELALGKIAFHENSDRMDWNSMDLFLQRSTGKCYGFLNYDLKNFIEKLPNPKQNSLAFPLTYFFEPLHLIYERDGNLYSQSLDLEDILESDLDFQEQSVMQCSQHRAMQNEAEYIRSVEKIKQHIIDGDVYELNYCLSYQATFAGSYLALYEQLNSISPNPFSAVLKFDGKLIVSASPERFIQQQGTTIISQPIKGTARRNGNDEEERNALLNNEKERSENVMIVDLVRNDLTKISEAGSISVPELFGIYSFPYLHQMISTVAAKLKKEILFSDILKATFPMGSMTGAPKVRAMELIDHYETHQRGAFSGSIGYHDAQTCTADFNVLIRSIFIDLNAGILEYKVGSAITYESDPQAEYHECLLKAAAIQQMLNITQ